MFFHVSFCVIISEVVIEFDIRVREEMNMKKLLFAMGTMVLACGLFFGNIPTANAAGISMSKELKPYGHMEEKDGISYYKYDNPSVLQLDKRPDRQSGFKISSGSIPSQYDGRYLID